MDSICYQIENSSTYGGMAYSRKFHRRCSALGSKGTKNTSPLSKVGLYDIPKSDKYVLWERQFLYAALP